MTSRACSNDVAAEAIEEPDPRFLQAALVLARKGLYADATKVLQEALLAGECGEAEALDLQARMLAQQGLLLHAESCWIRARQLPDANVAACDAALSRLRLAASPIRRMRWAVLAACGVCLLGLLLWNAVSIHQTVARHQESVCQSLAGVETELRDLREAGAAREHELAALFASYGERREAFEARASERLGSLATNSSVLESRALLQGRLDERVDSLQKSLDAGIKGLDGRSETWAAAQAKQAEAVATSLASIGSQAEVIGRLLGTSVQKQDALFVQTSSPKANSSDSIPVGEAVAGLRAKVDEIEVLVRQLVAAPDHGAGKERSTNETGTN